MHLQSQGILQRWLRSRTSRVVGRSLNYATVRSNPCMVLKRKETFSLLSEGRGRTVKKKRFCCCYYYCLLLYWLWQQTKGATSQVEGHSWRGSTRRARATLNVTGPSCYIAGHPSGDPTGTNRSIFKCPLTNSLSHSLSSSHGLKPETQRNPSFLIGIRCSIMAVTATRKLTHLTIPRPRNLFV